MSPLLPVPLSATHGLFLRYFCLPKKLKCLIKYILVFRSNSVLRVLSVFLELARSEPCFLLVSSFLYHHKSTERQDNAHTSTGNNAIGKDEKYEKNHCRGVWFVMILSTDPPRAKA